MNGKVWIGIGIALVLGAAVFGAGLFLGRTLLPAGMGSAGYGAGMMGSYGPGVGGMMPGGAGGAGMMGTYGQISAEPLSVEEARQAVEAYLASIDGTGLEVSEILIFDNHAYAVVNKADTGEGAFEVLVDPASRSVYLEFGPAMMWNSEYGMMTANGLAAMHGMGGMYGGMTMGHMGGLGSPSTGSSAADPTISPEQARQIAERYLEQTQSGVKAEPDTLAFPGYYTIHTQKDGRIVGMLSVNAYTGAVWLHTWHGSFIEESE
jgi:hypothetical protein